MFFTTSDLLRRMNSAVKDANPDFETSDGAPGFELQRKMPDGSYRRADESEMAAADFQVKLKQAAETIADLSQEEKLEWAKYQRKKGNLLFANGDFKEAMDVYLTCLVAIESPNSPANADDADDKSVNPKGKHESETEIQLPVLLNLALCAMKMGMLSKAEKFCNYAIDLDSGKTSAKAHFRRGKIRMLMGSYNLAESDLKIALEMINDIGDVAFDQTAIENERSVILREKQKLSRLVIEAKKNEKQQKEAMKAAMRGKTSLYPEKKGLSSPPVKKIVDVDQEFDITCFEFYIRMISRGAQKLLDYLGDEDEQDSGFAVENVPNTKKTS